MFEDLGFEILTAQQAAVWFGLGVGIVFGVLAELTRFCLRRGLVGEGPERRAALGVWLSAFALAILGTQAAVWAGWISFGGHRYTAADLPLVAIVLGGGMFGAGMVLTRGCASRLTVLAGSGNLRAAMVIVVFAITAHMTLKGLLAPMTAWLGGLTVPLGQGTLPLAFGGLLALAALAYAARSGAGARMLAGGALVGLLIPLGWVGTGFILHDEFDPIAMQSLSFTLPATEALFFTIASTAIPAGFGAALVGGVLLGAAAMALLSGRFQWQSFESPRQSGRYMAGAVLMGIGGPLAGGCTVGAGLSGSATLGLPALLALASIALGARLTDRLLSAPRAGSAGSSTTPRAQPAE